jgi:hypothetical protein
MTNSEGPQKLQPCIFPFTYEDTDYEGCTSADDKDGNFWCSTTTDGKYKVSN